MRLLLMLFFTTIIIVLLVCVVIELESRLLLRDPHYSIHYYTLPKTFKEISLNDHMKILIYNSHHKSMIPNEVLTSFTIKNTPTVLLTTYLSRPLEKFVNGMQTSVNNVTPINNCSVAFIKMIDELLSLPHSIGNSKYRVLSNESLNEYSLITNKSHLIVIHRR